MRHNRRAGAVRERPNGLEVLFRNGIGSVWSYRWSDKFVAFPFLNKSFDISHCLGIGFVVRNGKIDYRLPQNPSYTSFGCFISDGVFEVVHIAVGGSPAANHFRQSQSRSRANEFLGNVFRFRWKDKLCQPVLKIEVVSQASKQRHRNVRMPVDKTWNDNLPA